MPRAWAIVRQAALDMRRAPDHRAELVSQLLLGETVRIELRRAAGGWLRVTSEVDAYTGWVREWGVLVTGAASAAAWTRRATHTPRAAITHLRTRGGAVIGPVFFRSRLAPAGSGGRGVRLPDGRLAWLASGSLTALGGRPSLAILRRRISALLGVPYLWGGRTGAGLDCSAFVQLVMAEQGVDLPRDARQQLRVCRPLPDLAAARTGDLVFFARRGEPVTHVGILLGPQGRFAHCRGRVGYGSLRRGAVDYEHALARQLHAIARPAIASDARPHRSWPAVQP